MQRMTMQKMKQNRFLRGVRTAKKTVFCVLPAFLSDFLSDFIFIDLFFIRLSELSCLRVFIAKGFRFHPLCGPYRLEASVTIGVHLTTVLHPPSDRIICIPGLSKSDETKKNPGGLFAACRGRDGVRSVVDGYAITAIFALRLMRCEDVLSAQPVVCSHRIRMIR